MIVTLVVIMAFSIVLFATLVMVAMAIVALMENLGILPIVALTGNSSEEQTGGKQVKGFHLRRV